MHLRPRSAGFRNLETLNCLTRFGSANRSQVERALLEKIRLLAEQHARNVEALQRLKGITPHEAWPDDDNLVIPSQARSAHQLNRPWSPNDYHYPRARSANKMRRGPTRPEETFDGRRCFTRVTASNERSSKREPTVVKPFRSMETHTMAWKRKKRLQEEHDLQMKLEEQNAKDMDRERFIAGMKEGAPFSGVIDRSNKMIEGRRKNIIEAQAREEAKRKACMFKARPVHITDEDWRVIQERQSVMREQRLRRRQEEVASKSSLPRRMAMHAIHQKGAGAGGTGDRIHHGADVRPMSVDRKTIAPEKIVEVLARRQRLWDERLATSRLKKKPVVPQVLPMEQRQKAYKTRANERAQRKQDKLEAGRRLEEEETQKRKKNTFAAPVPIALRPTRSFLLKTAQVQARLDQARQDAKQEATRSEHARIREKETGKILMEAMREIDRQQGRRSRREIDEEVEHKIRQDSRMFRKALKTNKARLEQATANRLSLWEQHDAVVRKEGAKRVALTLLAEKVFQVGSDGVHWKRGSAADRIFDEEEKAALGITSF